LNLRSDNFDSVGELYTKDDPGELVVTIETAPAFFGGLGRKLIGTGSEPG
jgi:hypothetical protein